jgi:hypothetical protein
MRGDPDVIGPVLPVHFADSKKLLNPKSHRPAASGGPDGQYQRNVNGHCHPVVPTSSI